jgi:NitT/TauT family transport system ATP-binding protein
LTRDTGLGTRDAKIQVQSATRVFTEGDVVAFADLSLDVHPQEALCIVGPSGCGKTTLLRCIGGLIRPTVGRVLVDGTEVQGPPSGVAMVFQHFGLFPWKTVWENVTYGLKLAGVPRAQWKGPASHYLEMVGLAGFESAYPYQLSGGMQQRAGLARALAVNPAVLLMDEPFASLDAQTRELLQEELLRILENEPKTVLFITHSIDEAIVLGDRIVVMSARPGRVKEVLPVDLPKPRDASSRALARYQELREHIWVELKQEALASVA